jgi:hypothetical protein
MGCSVNKPTYRANTCAVPVTKRTDRPNAGAGARHQTGISAAADRRQTVQTAGRPSANGISVGAGKEREQATDCKRRNRCFRPLPNRRYGAWTAGRSPDGGIGRIRCYGLVRRQSAEVEQRADPIPGQANDYKDVAVAPVWPGGVFLWPPSTPSRAKGRNVHERYGLGRGTIRNTEEALKQFQ